MRDFKVVKQARGAAQAVIGVAAVEDRRLEVFAGLEYVAEVEGIEAAGHADRVELSPLHRDAPRTATRPMRRTRLRRVLHRRHWRCRGPRRGKSQTRDWPDGRWFPGGSRERALRLG